MTHREICEKIIEQNSCAGISCLECPLSGKHCVPHVELAKQWLEEHKEKNMDKSEAMRRLDAIETEAKALRDIIEKADKVQFDPSKVYVGIKDGCPYIMAGKDNEKYFRFHSFDMGDKTCIGYHEAEKTAQKCLDYHINAGFTIHAFDTTREAFEFFLKHLP